MSLTIPTSDQFYAFWGDDADTSDADRANLFLELSSDLLWLATDLDEDPTDSRLSMLVQYAICDMAVYLYVTRDDIDASYSPFQSERVGSYSYSKAYVSASKAVALGQQTGVLFFDRVVQYFLDLAYSADGGWGHNDRIPSLHREALALDPTWDFETRYRDLNGNV